MKLTKLQATIILSGMYIFFSLAANIAATKLIPFMGLIMDAGFIYALTFTWRDLIHKQLGKDAAITTILLSGVINLLAALYFQLVVILPPEAKWAASGGQIAWEFLFSIQFRIVIASIIAQIIAEFADTYTYQIWTMGIGKKKPQWLRVIVSNAVSIPIDSLLFPLIAFTSLIVHDSAFFWLMFISNIIVKGLMTVASFWMIYLVPEKPLYKNDIE